MIRESFLTFVTASLLILLSQCTSKNIISIFYKLPGYEEQISVDVDFESTVSDAIQEICRERQIQNGNHIRMIFKGKVIPGVQSLDDAGIGTDTV